LAGMDKTLAIHVDCFKLFMCTTISSHDHLQWGNSANV
jgi:hypothetical protein